MPLRKLIRTDQYRDAFIKLGSLVDNREADPASVLRNERMFKIKVSYLNDTRTVLFGAEVLNRAEHRDFVGPRSTESCIFVTDSSENILYINI